VGGGGKSPCAGDKDGERKGQGRPVGGEKRKGKTFREGSENILRLTRGVVPHKAQILQTSFVRGKKCKGVGVGERKRKESQKGGALVSCYEKSGSLFLCGFFKEKNQNTPANEEDLPERFGGGRSLGLLK